MIIAIVPMSPFMGGYLYLSNERISTFQLMKAHETIPVTIRSGRTLPISTDEVPIYRFKTISSWNGAYYEHVFVSQVPINAHTLTEINNPTMPAQLFPISMKRVGSIWGRSKHLPTSILSESYLFNQTINIWLQQYFRKAFAPCGEQHIAAPVYGMPMFINQVVIDLILDWYAREYRGLDSTTVDTAKHRSTVSDTITNGNPLEVVRTFNDLISHLFPAITDNDVMHLEELCADLFETGPSGCQSTDYNWTDRLEAGIPPIYGVLGYDWTTLRKCRNGMIEAYDLDPITLMCINTNSSISSTALLPFLQDVALNNFHQTDATVEITRQKQAMLNLVSGKTMPAGISHILDHALYLPDKGALLDNLVGLLIQMPATDVSISGNLMGTLTPEIVSQYRFPLPSIITAGMDPSNDRGTELIRLQIGHVFTALQEVVRNSTNTLIPAKVIITKNWLDDVIIEIYSPATDGQQSPVPVQVLYFNLIDYHVTGPCLVNDDSIETIKKLVYDTAGRQFH